MEAKALRARSGLYDPAATHASCGVGVLVDLTGAPSHRLVEEGLQLLVNLDHRGARGAEEKTGDGAGMLLQKPHGFFRSEIPILGDFDSYGVGQAFFPQEAQQQSILQALIEEEAYREGFRIIAWRDVPTDNAGLGKTALASEPTVKQFFVQPLQPQAPEQLDTRLYILRRVIEKAAAKQGFEPDNQFYICSLDRRKIVYKGLLTCGQLKDYYPDLSDERVATSLVLVHARFSTNTLGSWPLAHPYRYIVHNGEFNTLRGNRNWMRTREAELECERFGEELAKLKPIVSERVSDSAVFDNVLELLVEAGRSLPHALRMMIPEAWHKDPFMDPKRRDFYEYASALMEPWDGPALVAATDGYRIAAALDRNGLRPCRYWVTKDRKVIMASETGVLEVPAGEIVLKGRLKPGQLFLADTRKGEIIPEDEIFEALSQAPYGAWLSAQRVKLHEQPMLEEPVPLISEQPERVTSQQRAFGYTLERLRYLIEPMAKEGKDPLGAMGNDAPPAVLSARHKSLFDYFSQLFAQVSNPPIDYLREDLVTSLESYIGRQQNLLTETSEHCRQLFLNSPILSGAELEALKSLKESGIHAGELTITYPCGTGLAQAIEGIRQQAERMIRQGHEILVLSDRALGPERVAAPSLLAIGAVHHHLIRRGLRARTALVLDSGEPCAVHHFCTLIGFGADAVHPWLAYQSVMQLITQGKFNDALKSALARYRQALENGILKVMSKMGISTLQSYKGAQVFEAVGLDPEFVQEYFAGTSAHLAGVGLAQIERELLERHRAAFGNKVIGNLPLDAGGEFYWRRDGELHQWSPFTIGKLQQAARTADPEAYRAFADSINEQTQRLQTLRGLLDFKLDPKAAIPLEEVEPCETICQRFSTGSMSFGALSLEAHEALAVAMNRLGGKSGTGEGGEQIERFGTERECSMKQVASGRFGVTIDYLSRARQIEIKMAQGSKPGEGGELPGGKVNEGIAAVRFTVPGVGLISPPPHHDIYSIEDLAQLIHDLKCANPSAEIHVKLVALGGVGTIAAGVAKARADAVLISGDSGGTGASVKTSIKSAGAPWELGLAETQQVLLANNLRSRIRVRVDGGLKTGRDVVIAALLGAEEFGFGTAPLVALGCIMLRKCHCNTCSVGVATQDPLLRARFPGRPEHVINYIRFIAQEVRELMAALGFRTMDEMIGRVDKLVQRAVQHSKGISVDLGQLLYRPPSEDAPCKIKEQNHHLEGKIDHALIDLAHPTLDRGEPVTLRVKLKNSDRTVGTLLSSAVAQKYGSRGLPPDTLKIHCAGSAGQSFGAFLAGGITLHLTGDANDYIGKGLSGGKLSVRIPPEAAYRAEENILIGNVALYGATGGEAYFNGIAGERFAVRNSGAMAVVEGVGDHACEYMTGGVVVILGRTGKNFGAGMSGGEAFVFDETGEFSRRLNPQGLRTEPFAGERDQRLIRRLLENHIAYTESARAKQLLAHWPASAKSFVKVVPEAYAKVIEKALEEGKDLRPSLPPRAHESQAA